MFKGTVLFISNTDWYLENFRIETIAEFSSLGASVKTVGLNTGRNSELKKLSDYYALDIEPAGRNMFRELRSFFKIGHFLFTLRPGIVFSFNPKVNIYTSFWSWLLRLPYCPNISGLGELKNSKAKIDLILIRLLVFFLNRSSHVFFQNSSDLELLMEKGFKNGNSTILFGSGVDLRKYPIEVASSRTFSGRPLRCFMASRLIKDKGVEKFIELAIRFQDKNIEFYLAGIPDESSRRIDDNLLEQAVSSGALVFLGSIDNVNEVMSEMDIFILPSSYAEGLPKSLLEACAAGMIIVTSNTPGCLDVIRAGAGGLVCEPNVQELSVKLEYLLNLSNSELKSLSEKSRKVAERLADIRKNTQKYVEVSKEYL